MSFSGKQLRNATVANSKLATASNVASANSVVVSKSDTKIDISYIPTDDPLLRANFSYTSLASTDVITVPDGQTMLYADGIEVNDGTLIVEGNVYAVDPELVNLRPWTSVINVAGPTTLQVGKINKYNNTSALSMVLHFPASPAQGDVVELKETGASSNTVTLTTAAGTVMIERLDNTADATSALLVEGKLFLSYKWDAGNAVWRLVGSVSRGSGGSSLVEDALTTLATTVDGNPCSSTGLSQDPSAFAIILVYLNGVGINHISYGDKTGSLYFSNDDGATALLRAAVTTGSKLFWNGSVAGFQLQSGWTLRVVYSV